MSEANRLAAISAFLLKHRASPVFRPRHDQPAGIEPEDASESAEAFTHDLEALGPTFVKIGQMLSTRPDLVPPDYLLALSRLQDHAAPTPLADITRSIEEQLGQPMNKLFAEFDPEPVGTASFAQVHRARLPSGRDVAVKVQRPDLAALVDTDLAAVERLIRSLGLVSRAGERYGFIDWLDEFRATVRAELDYRQEADNLDTFHARLADYDRISVPRPVWDYTRRRVLVMDYVEGIQVTAIPDVLRTEIDLVPLANDLGKAYLDQVFVHGLIHADPHPGNVKLTPDHRLVLLDLGMVGYVPPRLRDQLLKLIVATIDGRGEQAAETFIHMGTRLEDFDEARFSRETARLVARFSSASTWTESEGGFLLTLVELGAHCGLKPPAELTLLGKTLLNLESVILALDPDASLREVLRRHMHDMLRERTLGTLDLGRLATEVLEVQELVREAPQRLSVLLRTLADNRFRVHVAGLEESHLIESMQKIANRITAGVIAAAMVVGAALIMDIRTPHTLLGYPALALVMFLVAVILGAALVVSSLLGDRRARPKAEKDPL
ncbi:ABC transporter substrate-binding protein [Arenimonas soli]|uniref:ABC transporter substrate-binding protein n=1 Tax=Arenimonas soli TaxID=2269504 RepID=A0ABQ1HA88_9GAMM|nr:AarF/UbiB family protein [Arenimonas soli]GGA66296.1 ABC transporter substrate-binding protein [Arenimonas soli]